MNRLVERFSWVCAAAVVGCSGPSAPGLAPVPASQTTAALVGPSCEGQSCACGSAAGQEVPEGVKRYEIQLGPAENELWATVGDAVLYKSGERATECYVVDLPPGKHPVRLRVTSDSHFGARLEIHEIAAEGAAMYDTFRFFCGSPGTCQRAELAEFKQRLATYEAGKHDPCGSTRIRQVRWQTGRLPDNLPPADLQLDLVLDVYKFVPAFPPGHAECAGETP